MRIEKSRFNSEAAPQSAASQDVIPANDFAAIVPVISGQIGGREANIVSAKALHKALGVGNDFSTWIKLRIEEYGFVLGTDYAVFDSSNFRNQSSENNQLGGGWVTKRGGDRRSKDYGLSLNMAKEVAMVERNEQGRAVRRYFIQCEEALILSAPEVAAKYRRQLKARIGAANLFKPMCAALEAARAELGKETQTRHYSNESNMIARIVLGGMTAKQWAQVSGIAGEPRDSMSAGQLEHLSYLESTNITLIDMGMVYDQRKAELTRLSQRWLAKRMGANDE
ncbi:antA/AntB antirepressor family protein [Pluralibacter gergoviae]|uniref:antA/AntB antirepressor family protein n=1 Tax=Pluralibacter gergoviae TaxID=61647 RepID=UPI000A3C07A8|nr:antA/AntB antirepressor family protein [Pluralibacter gergoviae]EKV3544681.1 antA/AntB antirepressor family protein [Pluralibacter gergoviae]EKV9900308.1 antA/AntB antirepressor family protein [Pluralibacter gergoviae]EKV9930839.1 antA/AntB antirepressor family protein [Pluralibacter gergoviae]OUF43712.1 phage anti-repressor protein [Pluralibacter gergoviae]OUF55473.1 phage anti-repressor protein [Pluralibacter gergoviae]